MGVVKVKEGVLFGVIAPAGFRILSAIDAASRMLNENITITSGTDGEHSGPDDPHHRGEAYDVRTWDLDAPAKVLAFIQQALTLSMGPDRFFAFIEASGTPNEHIHIQTKKGVPYP